MKNIISELLQTITIVLGVYLGVLFIAYCIVYLCACPSHTLAVAVGAEICGLLISIVIIRTKMFSIPRRFMDQIPESIKIKLQKMQDYINWCKFALLSLVVLFATVDFIAVNLSLQKMYAPAITLYTILPTT